jgi:hypothetical protein
MSFCVSHQCDVPRPGILDNDIRAESLFAQLERAGSLISEIMAHVVTNIGTVFRFSSMELVARIMHMRDERRRLTRRK